MPVRNNSVSMVYVAVFCFSWGICLLQDIVLIFSCIILLIPKKVRQMPLDEVVIVDADTNVVESPFDDISQLPADAVSWLNDNNS